MKKTILAGLFVLGFCGFAQAASTAVCAGPLTAGPGTAIAADEALFVKVAIAPKCSANVQLAYDQDATTFGVCANSKKGKNSFGGTTEGGGVSAQGDACPSTGCVAPTAAAATGCAGAAPAGT